MKPIRTGTFFPTRTGHVRRALLVPFAVLAVAGAMFVSEKLAPTPVDAARPERAARAPEPRTDPAVPRETGLPTAAAATGSTQRSGDLGERARAADDGPAGGRFLIVTAVDEATGDPIPGLGLQAFREQGGKSLLGEAITDDDGRAVFDELDRDLVLVESGRRPPYAPTLGAAWVPVGERGALELRVGRGGRVVGRIVDDLGAPLDGATIHLSRTSSGRRFGGSGGHDDEVVATTDVDGRFAVDAVHSRPLGVWLVDGEPRPERWDEVGVFARFRGVRTRTLAHVAAGQEVDLGDLTVGRAMRYVGRVIDHDGAAVAGAAVASDRHSMELRFRRAPPENPVFATTTDADGRFEVWGLQSRTFRVLAPDGRREYFEGPELDWGETSEPLTFQLHPATRIRLQLLSDGQRWTQPDSAPWRERVPAVLVDDGELEAYAIEDGDHFAVAWPVAPENVHAFRIGVEGHRPVRHEFLAPPRTDELVVVELEPWPVLRLEVLPPNVREHEPWASDPDHRSPVHLRACLARAERARERCCGLGSSATFGLGAEPGVLELTVRTSEPYWIHATGRGIERPLPGDLAEAPGDGRLDALRGLGYGQGTGDVVPASFGPFVPGPDAHPIRLDVDVSAFAAEVADGTEEPPPPSSPDDLVPRGRITVELADARTGDAVRGYGRVEVEDEDGDVRRFTDHGTELALRPPPGRWTVEVGASGYEPRSLVGTSVPGTTTSLGVVALEPRPAWRARLAPGDAWRGSLRIRLWSAGDDDWSRWVHGVGGLDEPWLAGHDLPPTVLVQVSSWSPPRAQRVRIERWSPDETREIPLEPWRDVAFDVAGLAPQHAELSIRIRVRLPAGDPRSPGVTLLEAAREGLVGGRVRYRCAVAAGTYDVRADSALYDFDPYPIDVADDDGLQVFTLPAR